MKLLTYQFSVEKQVSKMNGNLRSMKILWLASLLLLVLTFAYIYWYPHRSRVRDDVTKEMSSLSWDETSSLTRDDVWHYQGMSTCVCYGEDPNEICPKNECYCGGGDVMGSKDLQMLAVKEAIKNGGEHPKCPLL